MARLSKRLTAKTVESIATPGLHADGDGLYLRVDAAGAKRWVFLFRGPDPKNPGKLKRTEMGLGRLKDVGLVDARAKVVEARLKTKDGLNPIEHRAALIAAARAEPKAVDTFGKVATDYIDAQKSGFRNEKHIAQWRMTLGSAYCGDLIDMPVDEVDTADVLAVLQPIWQAKNETASRLRGRIERVLDAARAKGLRSGENPARWKGHLDKLLAKRQKLARGHHSAMPYAAVPAFVAKLRVSGGVGARALEFLILTAGRTGEVIGARVEEFDLAKSLWTVPGSRMKSGREHRVALSARAADIVRELRDTSISPFVFGATAHRPISNMTMTKALATAGGSEFTVHGFRSSFRDWVSEETSFPDRLAEGALAHIVGDQTELAYKRGDVLAKRRVLMDAWANYCGGRSNAKAPRTRTKKTVPA